MAVDTYIAYVGVYPSVEDAESDYQLVKDLHTEAGMLDAYDAAVIEKRDNGKVRITKKHETPTRAGGVIVVDNVVRGGRVADAGDTNDAVVGTRATYDLLASEPRLDATALQTVGGKGYDGFAIAVVSEA